MKILVVDDHEESAFVTKRLLSCLGHDVDVAYSGPAAIEKAATSHPDMIFLDLTMPMMDGFETCEKIRKIPALEHTIIFALTGLESSATIERAKEAGFNDIVIKATGVDALQQKIAAYQR